MGGESPRAAGPHEALPMRVHEVYGSRMSPRLRALRFSAGRP